MQKVILLLTLLFGVCSCYEIEEEIYFTRIGQNKVVILNCYDNYAVMERNTLIVKDIGTSKDYLTLSDTLDYDFLTLCVGYGANCEVQVIKLRQY